MALTSSGQIDLNAMHVEAGGTTGTECTLNDADIRDMIDKASGAQMGFNEWYGASSVVLDCSYVQPAVTDGKFPSKEVIMFLTTDRDDTTTDYYQMWNSTATHSSVNGSSSDPPFVGGGFFFGQRTFVLGQCE